MKHKHRFLIGAVVLAAAVPLAACGGGANDPGVASAGTSPTSTTTPNGSNASPIAYSRCMRAHGVKDFPDPDSAGRIAISGGPGSDLGPDNPTFQAAQRACQSLSPRRSPADQQQHLQDALQFSQCMRAHGVTDFPDPVQNSQGVGIQINGGQHADLNPNNPTFQAAQHACQHILGNVPGGGQKVTTGRGQGA